MLITILLATCDLGGSTLGICDCGTQVTDQISFELCGSQEGSTQLPGGSTEVPMRLCEYYVNGTIDEPTLGRITAWVPVGSRPCIGDEIPEPAPPRTIEDDIEDSFLAFSSRPWAYWQPGGELEVEVPAVFFVDGGSQTVNGALLGRAAQIRFAAVSATWTFSDGQGRSGFSAERVFLEPGEFTARAQVSYRIDYRYDGGSWVLGAGSGALSSNLLELDVVKIPRRTLLVLP